jgi:glycosyltransferase involved in cell wall biosynthesis
MSKFDKLKHKNIAILFPAWTNCGCYHVWTGQIAAYKEMGANVYPIALSMTPRVNPEDTKNWIAFLSSASEIKDLCYLSGPSYSSLINFYYLRHVVWPYFHGNHARMRTWLMSKVILPENIENKVFDLIHCNLFYTMPVATRLSSQRTPILLETIDIQANQFQIINRMSFSLKPQISYSDLLSEELSQLARATALVHLNIEEKEAFESLLPNSKHFLLYPRVNRIVPTNNRTEIIMIASNNAANVESVLWLLKEVAPRVPNFLISIYGGVNKGVSDISPGLYAKYLGLFKGEINSVEDAYKNAKVILLPTISGHGISIKTIEALSTGLPIIATSRAFRGMNNQVMELCDLAIADNAADYAKILAEFISNNHSRESLKIPKISNLQYYNDYFSFTKYCQSLYSIACQFL